MRKAIAVVGLCFAASLALTAAGNMQPLNVKTGLWQMTQSVTWTGLPPQLAAAMKNGQIVRYKSCVKDKDLNGNPWANGSGEKCVWTVLNSNGTDMEVKGTSCEMGKEYGMQLLDQALLAAINAKEVDPEHAYTYASDKRQFQRFVTDMTGVPAPAPDPAPASP